MTCSMTQTKSTILCVDDHQDTRSLLTCLFTLEGYGVMVAGTIAEALAFARRTAFDLFILDMLFPDGSGLDLCNQLRDLQPDVPVAFYSGVVDKNQVKRAFEAGGKMYLQKPLEVSDLQGAVNTLLGDRELAF